MTEILKSRNAVHSLRAHAKLLSYIVLFNVQIDYEHNDMQQIYYSLFREERIYT